MSQHIGSDGTFYRPKSWAVCNVDGAAFWSNKIHASAVLHMLQISTDLKNTKTQVWRFTSNFVKDFARIIFPNSPRKGGRAFGSHSLELLCCCFSVAQLCPTLCDPMDYSTQGFPVLHHLPEFAQTYVFRFEQMMPPMSQCFHPTISSSVAPF